MAQQQYGGLGLQGHRYGLRSLDRQMRSARRPVPYRPPPVVRQRVRRAPRLPPAIVVDDREPEPMQAEEPEPEEKEREVKMGPQVNPFARYHPAPVPMQGVMPHQIFEPDQMLPADFLLNQFRQSPEVQLSEVSEKAIRARRWLTSNQFDNRLRMQAPVFDYTLDIRSLENRDIERVFVELIYNCLRIIFGDNYIRISSSTWVTFTWVRANNEYSRRRFSVGFGESDPLRRIAIQVYRWLFDISTMQSAETSDWSLTHSIGIRVVEYRNFFQPGQGYNRAVDPQQRAHESKCMVKVLSQNECAFHAIAIGLAYVGWQTAGSADKEEKHLRYRLMRNQQPYLSTRLVTMTNQLSQLSGIPVGPIEPSVHMSRLQSAACVLEPCVQLNVVCARTGRVVSFGPYMGNPDRCIYLQMHEGHYNLITKMQAYYGKQFQFCHVCKKAMDKRTRHVCGVTRCFACTAVHILSATTSMLAETCERCDREFEYKECWDHHCFSCQHTKCTMCQQSYYSGRGKRPHKCYHYRCKRCKVQTPKGQPHTCWFQPTEDAKRPDPTWGVFDFESYQHRSTEHEVKLAISRTKNDVRVFRSIEDFIRYVFDPATDCEVWFAHNGSGWDFQFLIPALLRMGLIPDKPIYRGTKLFEMRFGTNRTKKVAFRCSMRHLPGKLSELAKRFGVKTRKSYFPYKLFSHANERKEWPCVPDEKEFIEADWTPAQIAEFRVWHAAEKKKGGPWILFDQLIDYCKIDVHALFEVLDKFFEVTKKSGGFHPAHYVTSPQRVQREWRTRFMPPNSVAMIDTLRDKGYMKQEAMNWVRYWAFVTQSGWMETALDFNQGKEACVAHINGRTYRFDAVDFRNSRVFEMVSCHENGCVWCCPYDRDDVHGNKGSYNERYATWQTYRARLQSPLWTYICIWECQWKQVKRLSFENWSQFTNRNYWEELMSVGTLPLTAIEYAKWYARPDGGQDPWGRVICGGDAIRGGKVLVGYMDRELKDDEVIESQDVKSMYPGIIAEMPFPKGLPRIIRWPHPTKQSGRTRCRMIDDYRQYKGIIYCTILPPKKLLHPVLGIHVDSRLVFPLCGTCAREQIAKHPHGVPIYDEAEMMLLACQHTDDQRALTDVWITPQIDRALERGYRLMEIYEMRHFDQWSTDDFKPFVYHHYPTKVYADGYADEKERDHVIAANRRKHPGMILDPEQFSRERDELWRLLKKIDINSLTGKYGQHEDFTEFHFVQPHSNDLRKLARRYNHSYDIDLYESYADADRFAVSRKDELESEGNMTRNPYLSAYIVGYGQLQLEAKQYEVAQKYSYDGHDPIIYGDTDSLRWVVKKTDQVEQGYALGDWASEDRIKRMIVLTSKFYVYEDVHGKIVLRTKGFTQSNVTNPQLSFDRLKRLVRGGDVGTLPSRTVTSKGGVVKMHECQKKFTRSYTKGHVVERDNGWIQCIPFGYVA